MERVDLITELYKGNTFFTKKILINDNVYFENIKENIVSFKECVFEEELIFENIQKPDLIFVFTKCTFRSIVKFNNCNFKEIAFQSIQEFQNIQMSGEYDSIRFIKNGLDNNPSNLKGNVLINSNKLDKVFFRDFELNGKIELFSNRENFFRAYFENLTVDELYIKDCSFLPESNFRGMQIKNNAVFENCESKNTIYFDKSYFESGSNFQFHNCSFKS